jgi:formate dehydrogenase maturation protein FdhE
MSDTASKAISGKKATDRIIEILAEAEQPLPDYMEFFRQIILAQIEITPPDQSEIIKEFKQRSEQRLGESIPAITFADLSINWEETLNLFKKVVALTCTYVSQETSEKDHLLVCCESSDILAHSVKQWFEEGSSPRDATSHCHRAPNSLISSVLQVTLFPVLSSYSDALSPLVNQELWQKNYCPVCGGSPDFSFLDKERGSRWLLCSRCDSQWLFKRLQCPYCGNDDHKSLAYYTNEQNYYRLYTCDNCRKYIKAVDLRKTDEEILLPLERVLTLDMDRQAHEMDYSAGI